MKKICLNAHRSGHRGIFNFYSPLTICWSRLPCLKLSFSATFLVLIHRSGTRVRWDYSLDLCQCCGRSLCTIYYVYAYDPPMTISWRSPRQRIDIAHVFCTTKHLFLICEFLFFIRFVSMRCSSGSDDNKVLGRLLPNPFQSLDRTRSKHCFLFK